MNDMSYLLQGMFTPTCLAHFVSSWAAFVLFTGIFILGGYWNGVSRRWRRNAIEQHRQEKPGPVSTLALFAVMMILCYFGYHYVDGLRDAAFKTGMLEITHNGVHKSLPKGSDEYEKQMAILFFCKNLILFFVVVATLGTWKRLRPTPALDTETSV